MTVCSFLGEPYALPFDAGFEPAWHELNRLVSYIKDPEKCADCADKAFCINCPGMLYAESGANNEVSERVCSMAKALHSHFIVDSSK